MQLDTGRGKLAERDLISQMLRPLLRTGQYPSTSLRPFEDTNVVDKRYSVQPGLLIVVGDPDRIT